MGQLINQPKEICIFVVNRVKSNTDDKLLASIRLDKVAFVFQSFNLISSLSAIENVELPMQLKGSLSRKEIRLRAKNLLSEVGLAHRFDHFPNQLSGGEQQRVTIARALSNSPIILLLDEPTGDLDTKSSDIVMKIIMDLNRDKDITMVMVTHDVSLRNFASKIVRMSDGKIGSFEDVPSALRERNYRKLKKRVEDIENGTSKSVLDVREGVEGYGNDQDEGNMGKVEEEKMPPVSDDYDDESEPQDPGINRNLPHRMKFIGEQRTNKTSVRMPGDYPFQKRVCYLD